MGRDRVEVGCKTADTLTMRNGVHLVTYADRLGGGGLATIRDLLVNRLRGAFTGVHVLPFYKPFDGADAGFDPVDHRTVDPRLGDWEDLRHLCSSFDVTADLIVNHISADSSEFRDYQANGEASRFAGMFLGFDSVFPDGATEADLLRVYRPRPGLPFTAFVMADGSTRRIWTTFTPQQLDLDVTDPAARAYLRAILNRLVEAGVRQVRLDAVGYAVKTAATSCFLTPETMAFIEEIGSEVENRGMAALLETHAHYTKQLQVAALAERVYDFALPPLVLHALYTGSADRLRRWLEISPRNVVTVLDTHDGIGVIDVGPTPNEPGLLTATQIDELVNGIHHSSGNESRLATGSAASNLDLYQVNCTYYSALGCNDDRYLLARLIQFLSPGIPQVYYAGLLAAPNDTALLARTGVGRDINRPYFTKQQIDIELRRPVVSALVNLARFRNYHPAFEGDFRVGNGSSHELTLEWTTDRATVSARIDVENARFELHHTVEGVGEVINDWDDFHVLS